MAEFVRVTWTPSVTSGVTSQEIHRAIDGGSFSLLATIADNTTATYDDETANTPGETYDYKVRGVIGTDAGDFTTVESITLSGGSVQDITATLTPSSSSGSPHQFSSDPSSQGASPTTITITFSEAVTGLEVADFTLSAGSGFLANVSGSGTVWTVALSNQGSETGTLTLNANAVTAASNSDTNLASNTLYWQSM